MHADGVLQSWKQIANYVGRTERTVQRWEREFGFPIRRPSGKARSAVMALVSEIQQWTRDKPSLNEIQQTERLRRKKFVTSPENYSVPHKPVQSGCREVPVLPASDCESDVTQQAITMKYLALLSQCTLLEENLANFRKELQQQLIRRNDLAETRTKCREIHEKLKRTMDGTERL